jgi:ABC-2 type transport system permease protein
MTIAMFRVMFLSLLNDRGALIMAFLLPVIFFLVLAEIFSGSGGPQMEVRVAIADELDDELSGRLIDALTASDAIRVVSDKPLDARQVAALVAKGTADVGMVLRADARPLGDVGGFGVSPILLLSDPVRGVAVPMLAGQIQKAYFEAMPDVALGSVAKLIEDQFIELDAEQRADLQAGLAAMRVDAMQGRAAGWSFAEMIERQDVVGQTNATNYVAYYAGAVAFMFLLFACAQGAVSLTEERESGILDRVMAGPGGIVVMVNGKFLFLVFQGFVQMLLIFVTAWLVYDVDLPAHFAAWLVITVLACIAAAGLSLLLAAVCRTPPQARNLATVFILIASMLGGSMVPRFFMPIWLRDLGWFTPNTWVLEAYSAVFWRGEGLADIVLPCALLIGLGFSALLLAQWIAARRARI